MQTQIETAEVSREIAQAQVSQPGAESASTSWHVAPKSGIARDRMLKDLDGVPKVALRTAFGKVMGRRIWEQVRRSNEPARRAETATGTKAIWRGVAAEFSDADLVLAMIESVSRRAAETLSTHKRQAKAIGLVLTYVDGAVTSETARLARPSADAVEISAAAIALFRSSQAREAALVSINLTTLTLQAEAVLDSAAALSCSMTPSHA
jgi:hypothetical protein